MNKFLGLSVFTLLLTSSTLLSQQKVDSKFGQGVYIIASDSSFTMKFNARIQSLMMFQTPADNITMDGMTSNWLIRRSRLKFSGIAYSKKLKYKIELGLSNRDHGGENFHTNNTSNLILDAFVRWDFYKNMELWLGQTKLPGNRERVISSQKLQFVDRSLLNSHYNIDRDMGIQFRNNIHFGSVYTIQALAISQGEGRNRTNKNDPNPKNGFEYTARLELLPLGEFTGNGDYFSSDLKREETPKVSFGITYDVNINAARLGGNLGSYVEDTDNIVIDSALSNLNTIIADVMFKYKGFSLMSEYVNKKMDGVRTFDGIDIINNYKTGTGLNIQAGYLLTNNIEPSLRFTLITPDAESQRNLQEMWTFGLSRYISNHSLKVQTDFSIITETEQQSFEEHKEFMLRFQVEMAF
jgi:hypothetical protein